MDWEIVSTAIDAGGVLPLLAYFYHRSEKHQAQLEERMEAHRKEEVVTDEVFFTAAATF